MILDLSENVRAVANFAFRHSGKMKTYLYVVTRVVFDNNTIRNS